MIENDKKNQPISRAKNEVFVKQHSKIGRYYTEHESQIIKN